MSFAPGALVTLPNEAHDENPMMGLARGHALSACDAACPETALSRGDSLATFDRALAGAAAAEGVSVIH